jgi:hypothetical protein
MLLDVFRFNVESEGLLKNEDHRLSLSDNLTRKGC